MTRKTITVTNDQGEQIEHADIDIVKINHSAGLLSLHRDGKPVAIYQRFAWHHLTSEEQGEPRQEKSVEQAALDDLLTPDRKAAIALAESIEHDLHAIKALARTSFK